MVALGNKSREDGLSKDVTASTAAGRSFRLRNTRGTQNSLSYGDLPTCNSKQGNGRIQISASDSDLLKPSTSSPLLCGLTADQVEDWQRFPHLQYGYRCGGSYMGCLASLFRLHNETVNAWTTLLSVIVGMMLFINTVSKLRCTWLEFSPFLTAWVGQILHGPLSCGYHLFMCMSPVVANRWRKADLTFIFVANICGTYAISYYTFGLFLSLAWTALVATVAAVGICNVVVLQPKQRLDRLRIVGVVGLTACGYFFPLLIRGIAALALQGKGWPELGIALVVITCNFTGAALYAAHWPERHFPGWFDYAGFSHNLMHVFCFVAYNCAYPYLSHLYSQREEWAAALQGAAAR